MLRDILDAASDESARARARRDGSRRRTLRDGAAVHSRRVGHDLARTEYAPWIELVKICRIHIMGASGAGVTSLGRALADALAISHHDTDDYLWQPTTTPYREMRAVADRLRLMREVFLDRADWVSVVRSPAGRSPYSAL